MKLFLFSIIYLFSLIFEVSFISFWGMMFPVSFWVFIICIYFLRKDVFFIFGIISTIFVLIFFTAFSLYFSAIVMGTASALLIRSFQGLNKKTAFMAHALAAIIIFELFHVFIFMPGRFSGFLWKETATNAVFSIVILLAVIFYEFRHRFNTGYRI